MASYRSIPARREPIATGIFEYTQTEEFATGFEAFSPSKSYAEQAAHRRSYPTSLFSQGDA